MTNATPREVYLNPDGKKVAVDDSGNWRLINGLGEPKGPFAKAPASGSQPIENGVFQPAVAVSATTPPASATVRPAPVTPTPQPASAAPQVQPVAPVVQPPPPPTVPPPPVAAPPAASGGGANPPPPSAPRQSWKGLPRPTGKETGVVAILLLAIFLAGVATNKFLLNPSETASKKETVVANPAPAPRPAVREISRDKPAESQPVAIKWVELTPIARFNRINLKCGEKGKWGDIDIEFVAVALEHEKPENIQKYYDTCDVAELVAKAKEVEKTKVADSNPPAKPGETQVAPRPCRDPKMTWDPEVNMCSTRNARSR